MVVGVDGQDLYKLLLVVSSHLLPGSLSTVALATLLPDLLLQDLISLTLEELRVNWETISLTIYQKTNKQNPRSNKNKRNENNS